MQAMARAGCAIGSRPALRHPAQHASASTVGLLACGSPPVTAFPGLSQWPCGTGSPLTVAGAAADLEPAFRTAFPVRSRVRDRRWGHLAVVIELLSMQLWRQFAAPQASAIVDSVVGSPRGDPK